MMTILTHWIAALIGIGIGYYAHYRWGDALKSDLQKVETAVKDIKK